MRVQSISSAKWTNAGVFKMSLFLSCIVLDASIVATFACSKNQWSQRSCSCLNKTFQVRCKAEQRATVGVDCSKQNLVSSILFFMDIL
jgi:hypothetical protein